MDATVLEPTLTIRELAAALGVSVQTLYDLRSQGRGPTGFRVGRSLRFRRTEVEEWLSRLEAEDLRRHRLVSSDVRERNERARTFALVASADRTEAGR